MESFTKARKDKIKEDLELQDTYAWLYGSYVLQAIGAALSPRQNKYPEKARGLDMKFDEPNEDEHDGKHMTDGQKFYLFMIEHNKQLKNRRKK